MSILRAVSVKRGDRWIATYIVNTHINEDAA